MSLKIKSKKELGRNALAMHGGEVLTDRPSLWVFIGYATFAAVLVGWCMTSTVGWETTLGIIAIHIITTFLLCYFKAHPADLSLLKPVSAGGKKTGEANPFGDFAGKPKQLKTNTKKK